MIEFYELYESIPSLELCLVHSKKKAREALCKLGMNDELLPSDATTYYREGDKTFIVYIDKKSLHHDATEDIGLLAHEATHVAQGYFRAIGEERPSDEFQAYTVQALTQKLCEQHFKWKKKRLAAS